MEIVKIAEAEVYLTPPPNQRKLRSLLSPQTHSLHNMATGVMTLAAGTNNGLHSHQQAEEIWYIIAGRGKVRIGDETASVEAGMVIYGPPLAPHGFINDGDEDLTALFVISPAGDEQPILDGLARQRDQARQGRMT